MVGRGAGRVVILLLDLDLHEKVRGWELGPTNFF